MVLGPYSSGVTLAVAPVLEKYKIPMITGSAESPMIWKQKFFYTFGTIPPVNFTGATPIETLKSLDPAPETAVILGSNDTFSKATAEAFNTAAEAAGIKVRKFNIVPSGQDLTPFMSAIKVLRPDLVAFGGHDEELINLVKSLRQIDYTPKALLMHYGVTEPAFVEALGKYAEGVLGASVWTETVHTQSDLLWKDAATYAQAAEKMFGVPADYTQAGSSTAGIAFQAALQVVGAAPPLKSRTVRPSSSVPRQTPRQNCSSPWSPGKSAKRPVDAPPASGSRGSSPGCRPNRALTRRAAALDCSDRPASYPAGDTPCFFYCRRRW